MIRSYTFMRIIHDPGDVSSCFSRSRSGRLKNASLQDERGAILVIFE